MINSTIVTGLYYIQDVGNGTVSLRRAQIAPPLENGIYYIQNVGTGTVITLEGGSAENRGKVQNWHRVELGADPGAPTELWSIVLVKGTESTYTIQNVSGRTFLDLQSGNIADGTPVQGYAWANNANQRWVIRSNTHKTGYVICNSGTGKQVDLPNGNRANGVGLMCWSGEGPETTNLNQLWNFLRV